MSEAPIPTFEDNVANREKALLVLEKAKAYEKKTKQAFHGTYLL